MQIANNLRIRENYSSGQNYSLGQNIHFKNTQDYDQIKALLAFKMTWKMNCNFIASE